MNEATSDRGGLGWFYGFKLYAVTNQHGVICRFAVISANEHEVTVAKCLLASTNASVIGDKGCGAHRYIYAQPRNNELHPRVWTPALGWLRKSIAPVFASALQASTDQPAQLVLVNQG